MNYHNWGNCTVCNGFLYIVGTEQDINHNEITVVNLSTLEQRIVKIDRTIFARPNVSSNGRDMLYVFGGYPAGNDDSSDYSIFKINGFNITRIHYSVLNADGTNSSAMDYFKSGNVEKLIVTGGTPLKRQNRTMFLNSTTIPNPIIIPSHGYVRHCGTFIYKDSLYEVGGYKEDPVPALAETQIYKFTPNTNLTNGTWTKWGDLPFGRVRAGTYVDESRDLVYILGGGTKMSNAVSANVWCTKDNYIQKLDMTSKTFTNVPLESIPPQKRMTRQFIYDRKLWQWTETELWCRWIDDVIDF